MYEYGAYTAMDRRVSIDTELDEDPARVAFHRAGRHDELRRDPIVGVALSHKRENFPLPSRQSLASTERSILRRHSSPGPHGALLSPGRARGIPARLYKP
jgi:hypothetical protein